MYTASLAEERTYSSCGLELYPMTYTLEHEINRWTSKPNTHVVQKLSGHADKDTNRHTYTLQSVTRQQSTHKHANGHYSQADDLTCCTAAGPSRTSLHFK